MNETTRDVPDFSASLVGIDMPPRIQALPVCPRRRVPVPWFVGWVDGAPEFRCADPAKLVRAVREKRCWVCGEVLGRTFTAVLGPMCSITRTTSEPPCHLDCATFSVRACPFLTKPHMHRRENGLPEGRQVRGYLIPRNPGVMALWNMRDYAIFDDGRGGALFRVGDPVSVSWWAQGRTATRAEVEASIRSGLPALTGPATEEGPEAVADLERLIVDARRWLPAA